MNENSCAIEGCDRPGRLRRGMCRMHYCRSLAAGEIERIRVDREPVCTVAGCQAPHYGRGFCKSHYRRDYYERNAAAETAQQAAYIAENRELYSLRTREHAHRRYMRRTGLASNPTRVDYQAIVDEHGMTCHICGSPIRDFQDLHFDHVIPLAKGGTHCADNIRPAHAACNLQKGQQIIE